MRRRFASLGRVMLPVAALLLAPSLSAGGGTSARHETLSLPYQKLGSTIRSVRTMLGEPDQIEQKLVPTPHEPKLRNVRVSLLYPDLSVTLLVVLCCDESLLEHVRVTSAAAAGRAGLPFPETEAAVVERLGTPSRREPHALVFDVPNDVGVDTITFGLRQQRVTSVEWRYWID